MLIAQVLCNRHALHHFLAVDVEDWHLLVGIVCECVVHQQLFSHLLTVFHFRPLVELDGLFLERNVLVVQHHADELGATAKVKVDELVVRHRCCLIHAGKALSELQRIVRNESL